MSVLLNLLCPICAEKFGNAEDIYSTSCGHVFHSQCMREWQSRSNACPQCHEDGPSTHKLYLRFDENAAQSANELRGSLEKSSKEMQELKQRLYDRNIVLVHERCESEKEIGELKRLINNLKSKIVCLEGSTSKQRQQIFSLTQEMSNLEANSETAVAELNKEIDNLKKDLEDISTEFAIEVSKHVHISEQWSPQSMQQYPAMSSENSIYKDKIEALEKQLKHISAEFEKGVTKSSQLQMDNIKLQDYIDCTQPNSSRSVSDPNDMNQESSVTSSSFEILSVPHEPIIRDVKKQTLLVPSNDPSPSTREETSQSDDTTTNSVIIENNTSQNLLGPLENTLMLMIRASKMGFSTPKFTFLRSLSSFFRTSPEQKSEDEFSDYEFE